MPKNILIVDDEPNHRLMLRLHLEQAGHRATEAVNGQQALERIAREAFDLILLDLQMDVMDGLTLLGELRRQGREIPVIVITAHGSVKTAVQAMKLGALDFLAKPVEVAELLRLVDQPQRVAAPPEIPRDYRFPGVSGSVMGKVLDLLAMVAPTDASVLILGESGTGKELVARSLHDNSPRAQGAFLAVNCAALSEHLVESELFGHEKGAFTSAAVAKPGKFELAEGGTLFLDEIGELPLALQPKLLRALQEKTFERVGGTRTLKADVRIVAATNRDLHEQVRAGAFREDLFFRLNVFPVRLPPLRERRDEIPLLLRYFIDKYAPRFNKLIKGWSDGFLKKLEIYSFPGNIRELENLVERSIILARGDVLDEQLLPDLSRASSVRDDASVDLKEREKQAIRQALAQTGGNKSKAADLLGISRRALHYKIKDYGLG
ncbi:two-component system, NtrC family, response regulator HydG [Geoalkalibacter ferrihydriticus]|uniref:Transcriptional regulator n=2 Tax=Geoalkalibacter ferrihydriticus TaxID=392333 RepID=A0A0C2EH75_9BACT|nr:sigma-54 dependent transcriptional regulator [Geoalkalibacter ferrihydriticus]KIH78018.1 transcriptional regulator [Geoalkalibacter ferrihydriticus DSM 17813]SDM32873.1 two-component system, NtrC family, response regulator HydG [Geoalkalibacter ferrihydriticus]